METPTVDEMMKTAYFYYEHGQFNEAVTEWRDTLRLDPELAEAHYNIGFVLDEQGRTEEALAEWRTASRIRPDYWEAFNAIGSAYFVQAKKSGSNADLRACLDAYRKAIAYGPHDARLLSDIGSVEWYLGDRKAAEESLKTAIRVDPTFHNAYRKLGRLYMESGGWINAWRIASALTKLPDFDSDSININYKELFRGLILPLTVVAAIVVFMQKGRKAA